MSKQEPERPRSMREIRRRMRQFEKITRDTEIQSRKGFLFPIGFSGVVVNSEDIKEELKNIQKGVGRILRKMYRR